MPFILPFTSVLRSAWLCVYLYARMSQRPHIQTSPNFLYVLMLAVRQWLGPPPTTTTVMIAEFGYILAYINKCSAVAEMGDCLAILNMGQKLGAVPLWGALGPHLTHCCLGRGLARTKWHLDPSSRLATTDMGRKLGWLCPFTGSWLPI